MHNLQSLPFEPIKSITGAAGTARSTSAGVFPAIRPPIARSLCCL